MADDDKNTDDTKTKTFTEDQVEAIVERRLKRERAKYSDYDELKTKVAELAKGGGGKDDKGEVDQLTQQIAKLNEDLADERIERMRIEVAAAKGLTPAHTKRLTGKTREELEDNADDLLADFPIPEKSDTTKGDGGSDGTGPKRPPSRKPDADLKGGIDPSEGVTETDPAKLAEAVPRL